MQDAVATSNLNLSRLAAPSSALLTLHCAYFEVTNLGSCETSASVQRENEAGGKMNHAGLEGNGSESVRGVCWQRNGRQCIC